MKNLLINVMIDEIYSKGFVNVQHIDTKKGYCFVDWRVKYGNAVVFKSDKDHLVCFYGHDIEGHEYIVVR